MHGVWHGLVLPTRQGSSIRSVDDDGFGYPLGPRDQLPHDLKTPLTTIHGRAQLLARAIRRSPSLAEQERVKMLENVAEIEATVRVMAGVIETISGDKDNPPP